jgi:hypothetical protein
VSKKPQPQVQTVTSGPPAYLEPYYQNAAKQATSMYESGGGFYQGNPLAAQSDVTLQALDLTRNRALNGNPLDAAAQQGTLATARGDFLGANPFLDSMADAANRSTIRQFRDATMPSLQSSFARAGRYGSNAAANTIQGAQEALATGLGDSNARLYGTDYANERRNMLAAAGMAPALTQTDFRNLSVLEGVGGAMDERSQEELNAIIAQQTQGRAALDEYIARLNGVSGNYTNQTTTAPAVRTNRLAGALGGAASAVGMLGSLGGWGALSPGGNQMGMFGTTGSIQAPQGGIKWL